MFKNKKWATGPFLFFVVLLSGDNKKPLRGAFSTKTMVAGHRTAHLRIGARLYGNRSDSCNGTQSAAGCAADQAGLRCRHEPNDSLGHGQPQPIVFRQQRDRAAQSSCVARLLSRS